MSRLVWKRDHGMLKIRDRNEQIDLNRNLYALGFSVVRANWLPALLATLLLLGSYVGSGYVDAPLSFAVIRSLLIMIIGFSIYRVLLSEGRIAGLRAIATEDGRIGWRYIGVMFIILSPILFLGIVWTAPGTGVGPSSIAEIGLGLVMVICYGTGYIVLGTALPEVVERGDVSLADAITRGRQNYRAIGRALVFGPWLFRAGSMLIMILLAKNGVKTDLFTYGHHGEFQPAALVPMLLFSGCYVFAEVLTAIVLVRAYKRFPARVDDAAPA